MPAATNLIHLPDVSEALRACVNALVESRQNEHRKLSWVSLWSESPAMHTFVVVGIYDLPVGLVTWTGPPDTRNSRAASTSSPMSGVTPTRKFGGP